MKGIVITTKDEIYIKDFCEPHYLSFCDTVDGDIEVVRPMFLNSPLCMVINEEGKCKELDFNRFGSLLYGFYLHGTPIVGNVIITAEGFTEEGVGFIEPDEKSLADIFDTLKGLSISYRDGDEENAFKLKDITKEKGE